MSKRSYVAGNDRRVLCAQVPRLQSTVRDRRANWEQSLATLRAAKTFGARVTKTSIMLGCGESADEVLEALHLLRENGVPPAILQLCGVSIHAGPIQ